VVLDVSDLLSVAPRTFLKTAVKDCEWLSIRKPDPSGDLLLCPSGPKPVSLLQADTLRLNMAYLGARLIVTIAEPTDSGIRSVCNYCSRSGAELGQKSAVVGMIAIMRRTT
jgi:hypothetical protein